MTHAEKLQQLFDAALKDSTELSKPPTRAFPKALAEMPVGLNLPDPASAPALAPALARAPAPAPVTVVNVPAGPVVNAGLSQTTSAKIGTLSAEQHRQKTGNYRRVALITLGVILALTSCGFAWFVQSPQRVEALQEAIRDVR